MSDGNRSDDIFGSDGWVRCVECGKKLMRRREDGTLEFKFGEQARRGVSMTIEDGTVTMRCLRKSCNKVNSIKSKTN